MSWEAAAFEERVIPLNKRVWIRTDRRMMQRKSGIVIDSSDWPNQRNMLGWVVAKGGDVDDIALGDFVITEIYAGPLVDVNDTEYTVVHRDDIMAILGQQEVWHESSAFPRISTDTVR